MVELLRRARSRVGHDRHRAPALCTPPPGRRAASGCPVDAQRPPSAASAVGVLCCHQRVAEVQLSPSRRTLAAASWPFKPDWRFAPAPPRGAWPARRPPRLWLDLGCGGHRPAPSAPTRNTKFARAPPRPVSAVVAVRRNYDLCRWPGSLSLNPPDRRVRFCLTCNEE